MSTDETVIKVDGVYKDFKLPHLRKNSIKSVFTGVFDRQGARTVESQHALKDINFEVKKGEFFGIVGRNGSGKSTLLKILATIYQPTKGSVTINGKLVPFIELGVGFNPELTGRENVYLNGALLGFSKEEIDVLYNDIVEFAELEKFMDQKLKNYSSGMQVRLAFSMATRARTDILLVDEVLAVGDADFQRKCFNYFKSLKKQKVTVIFVTHDMNAVREYCDRAILINDSKIIEAGSAQAIATSYTRLFSEEESRSSDKNENRWGDGTVVIESPKQYHDQDNLSFEFIVKAKQDAKDLIIGFAIKDSQGLQIVASNTVLNNNDKIHLKMNEKVRLKYSLANYFNDGSYSIDLAVMDSDGITVRDWRSDCISFTIKKEVRLPSVTNPRVKVLETRL
jgi:ABC-2 type transport system ATP-binding protein